MAAVAAAVGGARKKAPPTPFYFGGLASCFAAICTHPLDLIKVRLQTATSEAKKTGAKPPGMIATGINVVRAEGFFKLYTGLSAAILRQATYSTIRFGTYDVLKDMVGDTKEAPMSALTKVVLAMAAGGAGGICGSPADIVNIRMQNDGKLPVEQRRHYKHAFDGLYRIIREEGVLTLWKGWAPNTGRAMLMTAGQIATYDVFKTFLLSTSYFKDNLTTHFSASLLAGLVATTICSPLDVVKTRIMNSKPGDSKSTINVALQMLRNEGVMSFMKGWLPSYTRLGPHTIITFIALEQIKAWHVAYYTR